MLTSSHQSTTWTQQNCSSTPPIPSAAFLHTALPVRSTAIIATLADTVLPTTSALLSAPLPSTRPTCPKPQLRQLKAAQETHKRSTECHYQWMTSSLHWPSNARPSDVVSGQAAFPCSAPPTSPLFSAPLSCTTDDLTSLTYHFNSKAAVLNPLRVPTIKPTKPTALSPSFPPITRSVRPSQANPFTPSQEFT